MAKQNKSYEDLQVWQLAVELAERIYIATRKFPKEEMYGMTSQMRRCAVSIASNLAEGCARNNVKEFIQFVGIASGSAAELKTQLIIAKRVEVIPAETFDTLHAMAVRVESMLTGLAKSLATPATYNLQPATDYV